MPSDTPTSASSLNAPRTATDEPPRSVKGAVVLLGTSLTIGAAILLLYLLVVLMPWAPRRSASTWALVVVAILYYCFFLSVIRSIGRRRNWARRAVYALAAISCTATYFSIDTAARVAYLSQLTFQVVALCLLYSNPARRWFQEATGPDATASNNRSRGP
jgi:O-antigen/teichoic acid export membrane protein